MLTSGAAVTYISYVYIAFEGAYMWERFLVLKDLQ